MLALIAGEHNVCTFIGIEANFAYKSQEEALSMNHNR
jgi:hypothetical protein